MPLLPCIPDSCVDFIWFPHLDVAQLDNSAATCQK